MSQEMSNSFGQGPLSWQLEVIEANQPGTLLSPANYLIAENEPRTLDKTLQASYKYTSDSARRQEDMCMAFWAANNQHETLTAENEKRIPPDLLRDWDEIASEALNDSSTHIPAGLLEEVFHGPLEVTPAMKQASSGMELYGCEYEEAFIHGCNEYLARKAVLAERNKLNKKLRIASSLIGASGGLAIAGGMTGVVANLPSQEQLLTETTTELRSHEHASHVAAATGLLGLATMLSAVVIYGFRNHYARNMARKSVRSADADASVAKI